MTHEEMQRRFDSDDPISNRRQIFRMPDGTWWSSTTLERRTTTERNLAYVFPNHGASYSTIEDDAICEILPDEDAPTRVVPEAVVEVVHSEMQEYFNEHHRDTPQPFQIGSPCIIRVSDGKWRAHLNNWNEENLTTDRNRAFIFDNYGRTNGNPSYGWTIEVLPEVARTIPDVGEMDAAPAVIDPPEKANIIKRLFAPDFIRMLEAAPKNEMVRGWILKVTKQLPPEDCDTVDKIEAWLQSIQKEAGAPLVAPGKAVGFKITLDFTGSESGRCNYTVTTSGSDDFEFNDAELRSMVEESDGDFHTLLEYARESIGDNWNERTSATMEAGDNEYEYDHHDCVDGGDTEYDFSVFALKERLRSWVRENMPDQWARMNEENF